AVITLNNDVPLSNSDKELILSQIQATHEKIDNKNQGSDTNPGTSKGEDANAANTNNQYPQIESLEFVVLEGKRQLSNSSECKKKEGEIQNLLHSPATNSTENASTRQGAWGKIRESFASFFGDKGNALDESWTSKLKPEIDDQNKTINLQAPTRFIRDWIENNYQSYIEKAASMNGLRLEEIKYGGNK
ncbi:DnaA N-terminal domain-containing protein, partial [Rickettsiaceae bacterium]|nr:DnaA N-terminal domain-containing protein [Rickettsiaceae bacterium]